MNEEKAGLKLNLVDTESGENYFPSFKNYWIIFLHNNHKIYHQHKVELSYLPEGGGF